MQLEHGNDYRLLRPMGVSIHETPTKLMKAIADTEALEI
jgi:hypothetical protein